jgi:hypothetical protein
MKKILKNMYNNVLDLYITAFEKKTKWKLSENIDDYHLEFGDISMNYDEVRKIVDGKVKWKIYLEWYDFIVGNQFNKTQINVKNYQRERLKFIDMPINEFNDYIMGILNIKKT